MKLQASVYVGMIVVLFIISMLSLQSKDLSNHGTGFMIVTEVHMKVS